MSGNELLAGDRRRQWGTMLLAASIVLWTAGPHSDAADQAKSDDKHSVPPSPADPLVKQAMDHL